MQVFWQAYIVILPVFSNPSLLNRLFYESSTLIALRSLCGVSVTPDPTGSTMANNVILDSDLIPHGISRKFVKFPGESDDHFHGRVTHLHFQNRKIYQIGDLSMVKQLTVLYLYDNKIEKIEHLDAVINLQMLYLQRNRISRIENLSHLTKLKKLYLSNNRISVIENLESLHNLQGMIWSETR